MLGVAGGIVLAGCCAIGGCIVLIGIGAKGIPEKHEQHLWSGAAQPSQQVAALPSIPSEQTQFVILINNYAARYRAAPNEIQKTELRFSRKADIERLFGQKSATNWVGTLEKVKTNQDGTTYISIKLAPSGAAFVKTWNNRLSDLGSGTMIERGSPLYRALSAFSEGQAIVFSGEFLADGGQDFLRETSLTEDGSMTAPEFVMRFTAIGQSTPTVRPGSGSAAPELPPGDMTLKAFVLQKPSEPTAVQVDCELSTYYNFAYSNCAETHHSFRIGGRAGEHAYAPKDAEYGKRLYELLKDGEKRKFTLRIQRLGPDGLALPANDDSCFALVGIVENRQSIALPQRPAGERREDPHAAVPAKPETPAIKTEANALFTIYGSDVITGDTKYTGRLIELANIAGHVQKDNFGRYFLVAAEKARFVKRREQGPRIMSPSEFQRHMQESALNTKYMPGIILYLEPKEAVKFAGLGGRMVTVRGICKGRTQDQSTQPAYFVTLDNVCLSPTAADGPADNPGVAQADPEQQRERAQREEKVREAERQERIARERQEKQDKQIESENNSIKTYIKLKVPHGKYCKVEKFYDFVPATDGKQDGRVYRAIVTRRFYPGFPDTIDNPLVSYDYYFFVVDGVVLKHEVNAKGYKALKMCRVKQ
jgi:hypothetical protein